MKAIRKEAAIAREGKPARIIAKMNSLTDESVIRALYDGVERRRAHRPDRARRLRAAARACRACRNIRVRSIVGRFLEHSRIFYFRNDLQHDVYLAAPTG
jgi:polyphosphate kinase